MEFDDLKGIFVSGAGMTKAKFVKKGVLDYRLKDKVLDLIDVSYSGEAGIRETVIKIQDKIQSLRYIQEKQVFNRFMENISKDLVRFQPIRSRRSLPYRFCKRPRKVFQISILEPLVDPPLWHGRNGHIYVRVQEIIGLRLNLLFICHLV